MPELLDLVDKQSRQQDCDRCQASTSWCASEPDRRNSRRRRSRRVPVTMPIQVQIDPDGMGITEVTHTVDISKGGVRFLSKHNISEGMEVVARVPYDPEFEQMGVRAKVIWVRPVEKGVEIGIEFLT